MIDPETFAEPRSLCFLSQTFVVNLEPKELQCSCMLVPRCWKEEAEPATTAGEVGENIVVTPNQARESFGAYGPQCVVQVQQLGVSKEQTLTLLCAVVRKPPSSSNQSQCTDSSLKKWAFVYLLMANAKSNVHVFTPDDVSEGPAGFTGLHKNMNSKNLTRRICFEHLNEVVGCYKSHVKFKLTTHKKELGYFFGNHEYNVKVCLLWKDFSEEDL
ncbi:hypothetical protein BTVI_106991 [Pitangus sulphuratus]|nr:hypothetical protein BTVI_106991 [Pitangus sulphuratus]